MKMARASEADIEAAMKLCNALEQLERYRTMPPSDDADADADYDSFDENDREDCKKALGIVLELFGRASLFRVVFGMTVVLDPRNKILDPDADVLEIHPDIRREQEQGQKARGLLLWALYHHQGASSKVGQPIRRLLGIGEHDALTEEEIVIARLAAEEGTGHDYPACALFRGGKCSCDSSSEDSFNAEQAKAGGMPYGTYGGAD